MAAPKTSTRHSAIRPLKARRERDLEAMRDIADDVLESDFVPYACLYDPSTILTKDSELLQTIKISSAGFDSKGGSTLRDAIRRAIRDAVPDASYGIWLHTLRRQQSLITRHRFPDAFSGQLDEAWQAGQPNSASFVNELYITIVKAPTPLKLKSLAGFMKTLIPSRTRAMHHAELDELAESIQSVTKNILSILSPYSARMLSLVEREGVYYSEQLEFLEKLINLEDRQIAVPERDLSQVLTSGEITFGFNAMEVRTADGHRRFAAILTLKEYKESTLAGIDRFLEIPCEVIVTQCFGFAGADEARQEYTKQAHILNISGDKELAQWMEIDRLTAQRNVSYGQQQTTLFLIAPSMKQLEANVKMVRRALTRLGMVILREDLRFEDCYWAQLPGNFNFVARTAAVDTAHLAGFANLQPSPMGASQGSPWGPPVSLLSTVQDTPYSFNFHRDGRTHTVILGKPGSGRTTMTHFLLAQARKLQVRILYLDSTGRAKPFIEAMGGTYSRPGSAALKLNPLQMPDSPANHEFLTLWFSTLIDPYGTTLNRSTLDYFRSLLADVLRQPRSMRRLSALLQPLREADPVLASTLQQFCGGGKYGELFDMPDDTFTLGNLTAWDLRGWLDEDITRIPLTSYLLQRITAALDGKPTLIVLDEGFELLNTPLFSSRVDKWCDHLTQNNAGCIVTTSSIARSGALPFASHLAARAATILAMPDAEPDAEYAMGFGLSQEEISTLAYLDPTRHHVLQKRGHEALVLNMNLSRLKPHMLATLSGKPPREVRSPADTLAELMGMGGRG